LDASVTPFSKIVAAVEERQRQNKVADEANHLEPDCHSVKTTASEVDAIATLLSATIPHSKAASTPAKITVTELNKRLSDDAFNQPLSSGESPEPLAMTLVALTDDVSGEDDPSVNRGKNGKDGTPIKSTIIRSDMALTLREREESDQIKGATLGTLMHFIFQFIDIDKLARQATADGERICLSELRSMADADMITKEQEKAALPFVPQIVAWAKSSLAARLLEAEKATGRVYREMPFTMAIAASELRDDFPDDEITLVQGMIDLWFVEENEKVVLIDFKTDRLTFDTDEQADDEILRRYSTQIRYYAEAITKATEREVSEALIWLVRYARHVSVPLD
jgi:ATP-dependent exoDNAse (exonuclease V) beta subunit